MCKHVCSNKIVYFTISVLLWPLCYQPTASTWLHFQVLLGSFGVFSHTRAAELGFQRGGKCGSALLLVTCCAVLPQHGCNAPVCFFLAPFPQGCSFPCQGDGVALGGGVALGSGSGQPLTGKSFSLIPCASVTADCTLHPRVQVSDPLSFTLTCSVPSLSLWSPCFPHNPECSLLSEDTDTCFFSCFLVCLGDCSSFGGKHYFGHLLLALQCD